MLNMLAPLFQCSPGKAASTRSRAKRRGISPQAHRPSSPAKLTGRGAGRGSPKTPNNASLIGPISLRQSAIGRPCDFDRRLPICRVPSLLLLIVRALLRFALFLVGLHLTFGHGTFSKTASA
jgi:hypothetical protein